MRRFEFTTARAFANTKLPRWPIAAVVLSISILGCGHDKTADQRAARTPGDTASKIHETVAAGEVAPESGTHSPATTVRWITDANAVAVVSALNAREIAAADVELENWHVDTARAFAASMAREHAEFQHSVDSIAQRLNLTPVIPALAKRWTSSMQSQIDTVERAGSGLDLAFVRQQATSHQLMADYLSELAAVAERPAWQAFLEAAATNATLQAARARAVQATVAAIDSTRRSARSRGATR